MLENEVNTCIGCMIALVNSFNSYDEKPFAMKHIVKALHAIQSKEELGYWISLLREDKKKIVPDCFVCMNPCGRTDEISINALGEDFVEQTVDFLSKFESMSVSDLYYCIGALPYEKNFQKM